jgi:NADH:ubiquinone oxidoreductase subunit E
MFHTEPQGRYVVEICGSPSCVLNNGVKLEKFLEREIGVRIGETSKDGMFSLYKTSCIGCCDEAPAMLINGEPHTKMTAERARVLLKKLRTALKKKKRAKKKK